MVEQHRRGESADLIEEVAGTLLIPPAFVADPQLELGHYLECFITAVRPSESDEWFVPYPAQTAPPTGDSPEFDPTTVRATVRDCEIEFD